MRTFHIGGTASGVAAASEHIAKAAGVVRHHNIRSVVNRDGDIVVLNRSGEIIVADDRGRERERYPVVTGARIKMKDGARVKPGLKLVEWDNFNTPIPTEFSGTIALRDIVEGVTIREVIDEVTGLSQRVIIEDQEGKLQPRVSVKESRGGAEAIGPQDSLGETRGRYMLPVGAHLLVADGQEIFQGDIIAKIPREATKTKDITGGLPRVAELFEARKPKEQAVITEIDGAVEFAGFVKGMRKIVIRADDGETKEYLIPRGKHIAVHEGDRVKAGEALMDGSPNPHDYLAVLGDRELQRYLVNEVQEVYRLQGVTINDKHIEIIVRQMLRRVRIEEVGGTDFVVGELVDKFVFQEENEKAQAAGKPPSTAKPVLLGITKASLSTDSFISAASFQETTRVLTEAAISGKTDDLRGLKENVIVGRLIPAGTGLSNYTRAEVVSQGGDEPVVEVAVAEEEPPMDGESDEVAQAG
jgi:DNA-directed RNA polymerase subunit beta'